MSQPILTETRRRLAMVTQSIVQLDAALGATFESAVTLLAASSTIVTTGIGKSGIVAQKLAATLNSLQVPAIFVHPVEAMHGDSGVIRSGDAIVAFSKSGETPEVLRFIDMVRGRGCEVVGVSSRSGSRIEAMANVSIHAPYTHEQDAQDVVPTTSSTIALIIADLLAVAIAEHRGIGSDGLHTSHPHGLIGAALQRTVRDVMHAGSALPAVQAGTTLGSALAEMTSKSLGCVSVANASGQMVGFVTDGDVRRALERHVDVATASVDAIMTASPVTIHPDAKLLDALQLMERRDRQIGVMPVVEEGRCVGIIRLHDIVRLQV